MNPAKEEEKPVVDSLFASFATDQQDSLPPAPSGLHRPLDNWSKEASGKDKRLPDTAREQRSMAALDRNAQEIRKGIELLARPDLNALSSGEFIPVGRNEYELLSDSLFQSARTFGESTKLGKTLNSVSKQLQAVGKHQRTMQQKLKEKVIGPLFKFSDSEFPEIQKATKELEKRLAIRDQIKTKLTAVKKPQELQPLEKELKKATEKYKEQEKVVQFLINNKNANDWSRDHAMIVREMLEIYGQYCRACANSLKIALANEDPPKPK